MAQEENLPMLPLNQSENADLLFLLSDCTQCPVSDKILNNIKEHLAHLISVNDGVERLSILLDPFYQYILNSAESCFILELASSLMLTIRDLPFDNASMLDEHASLVHLLVLPEPDYAGLALRYKAACSEGSNSAAVFQLLDENNSRWCLTLSEAQQLALPGQHFDRVNDFVDRCVRWNNAALCSEGFDPLLSAAMLIGRAERRDPSVLRQALKKLANVEMGFIIQQASRCAFKLLGFYLLHALTKLKLPSRVQLCCLAGPRADWPSQKPLVPRVRTLVVDPLLNGRLSDRCSQLISMCGANSLQTLHYRNFIMAASHRGYNGHSDEDILAALRVQLDGKSIGAYVCFVSGESLDVSKANGEFYSKVIRLVGKAASKLSNLSILWCIERDCPQLKDLLPEDSAALERRVSHLFFTFGSSATADTTNRSSLWSCVRRKPNSQAWPVWQNVLQEFHNLRYTSC